MRGIDPINTQVAELGGRQKITVADLPEMAARYDPLNPLPASSVPARSNKRFMWRCNAGADHRWEAPATSIAGSKRGGCPFCAGKRPSVTNRLDLLYPEVAAQWDVILNGGFPAVVAGSEKKAWWQCSSGHSWQANIRNRTVLGAGCPHCAAELTSKRRSVPAPGKSLADVDPPIARQWHPLKNRPVTPEQVAAQSNTPVWWVCAQGHEWQISPSGRIAKGRSGCPFCSGRLATPETSLLALHPDIAAEWHAERNGQLTPANVKRTTAKSVWWICSSGHEYLSKIGNRTALGRGCPYCTNQKVGYGNDLASKRPDLAAQWHPKNNGALTPGEITAGTQRPVWWLCRHGHSWQSSVASRTSLGVGCPKCASGWRRSRPEILLQCELSALLPALVEGDVVVNTPQGSCRVDVLCRELRIVVEYDGSFWHEGNAARDQEKTDALISAGWFVIRIRQDPLRPVGPYDVACEAGSPDAYGFTLKVMDKIAESAAVFPSDHPCSSAAGVLRGKADGYRSRGMLLASELAHRMVAEGRRTMPPRKVSELPPQPRTGRSLAEKSPAIAREWHPTLNGQTGPENVANARNAPAWWLCSECGKEWPARISERVRRGTTGCPGCNRAKAGRGRARPVEGQSLADLYPDVAVQWHPALNGELSPADLRPNSHLRIWWMCDAGHEWASAVYNRTANARGCPQCPRGRNLPG